MLVKKILFLSFLFIAICKNIYAQGSLSELFRHGGAWITKDTILVAYGHNKFGRPNCGLFISTSFSMDTMLAHAKRLGNCYDIPYIENRLGIEKNTWKGKALIRFDVGYYQLSELNLRWATEEDIRCAGNILHIKDAHKTSGGMPEAFINQVPFESLYIEPKVLIPCP